jgi:cytochrome c5
MSEVHVEEHSSPIKTPKQLVITVLLAFLVPIIVIALLAQLATTGIDAGKKTSASSEAQVAARLQPVGAVEVVDPNAPKVEKTGKEVVDGACNACHGTGALGAPKIGDKAAWGPRLKDGLEKLRQIAISGIRQMPPRGGDSTLSDTEIARAIVFMANQSGANFKEPAANAAAAPAAKK